MTKYFGSNAHNIRAVDATTGNILWETGLSDGTVGVPAVANGVVYIGSFVVPCMHWMPLRVLFYGQGPI